MTQPFFTESWRFVPGFEGRYEVSNFGVVRSLCFANRYTLKLREVPHVLKTWKTRWGYERVRLCDKMFHVHTLVLLAFVGPKPKGCEAAHLDGVRTNNSAANLKWCTKKENHSHKWLHGTQQAGSRQGCAKLKEKNIPVIRRMRVAGATLGVIATKFGVTESTISSITKGKTWSHVK